MSSQLRSLIQISLIALPLALASCGKKSKSQDVKLALVPDRPLILNGQTTYIQNGQPVTVPGPWFKFQLVVDNEVSPAEPVTIVGVHVDVTGTDDGGLTSTLRYDYDPGQDDYSDATSGAQCSYFDFGQFDSGGTAITDITHIPATVNGNSLYEIGSNGCKSYSILVFYAGSLQKNIDGLSPLPTYTIQITPLGWFGTRSAQVERFTETLYTTSQ